MTEKIIKNIIALKQSPSLETVDHISILHELYCMYSDGMSELKPIAMLYVNGFDDLPTLKEKHLWNLDQYYNIMKPFYQSHSELIEIIDQLQQNRITK